MRALLFLLFLVAAASPLSAEEWVCLLTDGALPFALQPPVLDGSVTDLAWKAPASRRGETAFRVAADQQTLYLYLASQDDNDPLVEVEITCGPAPFLTKRLRFVAGAVSAQVRRDWGWAPGPEPVGLQWVWQGKNSCEVALPCSWIGLTQPLRGRRLALQIRIRQAGGRQARCDWKRGLVLGVDQTATALRVGSTVCVEVENWVRGGVPAVGEGALQYGPSEKALPPKPVPGAEPLRWPCPQVPEAVSLSLKRKGEPDQEWLVFPPWRKRPVSAIDFRRFFTARQRRGGDLKALLQACGEKDFPQSMRLLLVPLLSIDSPRYASWQTALSKPYDTEPSLPLDASLPPLNELYPLAQKNARWRTACDRLLTLHALGEDARRCGQKGNVEMIQTILKRYAAWLAWRRNQPVAHAGAMARLWSPDLALLRLETLTALLRGPLLHPHGQKLLLPCVTEWVETEHFLTTVLKRRSEPLRPDFARRLLRAIAAMPLLADFQARLGNSNAGLERQFRAHLCPGGGGRLPGSSELVVLDTVFTLTNLQQEKKLTPAMRSLAKALLQYQAQRILPGGHMLQVGRWGQVVSEMDLALWSERWFPDEVGFARFRPEGLVAMPLESSLPATSDSDEYSGYYMMRSGGLGLGVVMPPRSNADAVMMDGALLLARDEQLLLREPDALPAIALNGLPPHRQAMPVPGLPLPHRWMTGPVLDVLEGAWSPLPTGSACCRRLVALIKGRQAYAFVQDGVDWKGEAPKLTQRFHLSEKAPQALSIKPLSRRPAPFQLEAGPVALQYDLDKKDAAAVLLLPRGATHPLRSIGLVTPHGGGVVEGIFEKGRLDYLFHSPHGEKLEGMCGQTAYAFEGRLALLRQQGDSVLALGGFGLKQLVWTRPTERWSMDLAPPSSVTLQLRKDGSYWVRLESRRDDLVRIRLMVKAKAAKGARKAEISLQPGQSTVFRLF